MKIEEMPMKKPKLDNGSQSDKKPALTRISFSEEDVLTPAVLQAAEENNIGYIRTVFGGDLDVRIIRKKDGENSSLLATALDHNKLKLALVLIAAGTNVNAEVTLFSKVEGWNTQFSSRGPLIGHLKFWGYNQQEKLQVLNALIAAHVNLNVKLKFRTKWCSGTVLEGTGQTFLFQLVSSSDYPKEIIKILLEAGADPNLPNDPYNGFVETPLMQAIRCAKPDMVELLLNYGANIYHQWRESPSDNYAINTPMDLAKHYFLGENEIPLIKERHKQIWNLMQAAAMLRRNKWAILMGMHNRVGADSPIYNQLQKIQAIPLFSEIFSFLGPRRSDVGAELKTENSTSDSSGSSISPQGKT